MSNPKLEENLKLLEELANFKGGDNFDIPIGDYALNEADFIIKEIAECELPQPEIFPHAGGGAIQLEWEKENEWYLEINVYDNNHLPMFQNNNAEIFYFKDIDSISCEMSTYDAYNLAKLFLTTICK